MGTSGKLDVYGNPREDHPHAYGDKGAFTAVGTASEGSSPRVWGQGEVAVEAVEGYGIIPTRMGTRICEDNLNNKA